MFVRIALLLAMFMLAACGATTDNSAATGEDLAVAEIAESPAAAAAVGAPPAAVENAAANPASRNDKYSAPPEMVIDPSKRYTATIETSAGTLTAELYPEDAPKTVNNFVFLARDDFYDGIRFHRIIKDFMVQTGDPLGQGSGGPGYKFEDEPVTRPYTLGTLAMANAGPNTNGSQFFIVNTEQPPLEPNYTIFGQVTEGLDVLEQISNTPVAPNPMSGEPSAPTEEVVIQDITIEEQ